MENLIKIFVLVMLISSMARIIVSIATGIKYIYSEENLDEVN